MLDHLSRGRLEFGAGLGTHEHEFMRWDTPFDERRAMGDEALEIILKAWTEERVTYEGKYWRFDEALPVPKPYHSMIKFFVLDVLFRRVVAVSTDPAPDSAFAPSFFARPSGQLPSSHCTMPFVSCQAKIVP
jgi:hypothetical protein